MKNAVETFHTLSQLEGEMKRAEQVFLEADTRFQEVEAAYKEAERRFTIARRERDTALGTLNECHVDIDRTVGMLREASPIGCDWRTEADAMTAVAVDFDDPINFMLKD